MAFLINSKELAEAKAQVALLETKLATAEATIKQVTDAGIEAERESGELRVALETQKGANEVLGNKLKESAAALTAEQSAHATTKASVETLAATKAQQIAASLGMNPVASTAGQVSGDDAVATLNGITDPVKRAQFYKKNRNSILSGFVPARNR